MFEPLELVTLDEARAHLRIAAADGDADATWLSIWIPVISQAVASWLKDWWRLYMPVLNSKGDPEEDSNGDWIPQEDSNGFVVNPSVRGAVLIELAWQFRFREGDGDNTVPADAGYGYTLCRASTALLSPIRKTTVR